MSSRKIALVVFYDSDNSIYLQDRKSHSKVGEKYGFFGGQIHENETPKQALERELIEEMNYLPSDLVYWDAFNYTITEECKYTGWKIYFHVFLSLVEKGFEKREVFEGDGIIKMPLEKVIDGEGFPIGSTIFMKGFESQRK